MRKQERAKQVLQFCKTYISENGYPPSYQEIGNACQIESKSTVFAIMQWLRENGLIVSKGENGLSRAFSIAGSKFEFDEEFINNRLAEVTNAN